MTINHKPGSRPLQAIQLIIFAALAAVVLYQLYSVLGRRVGRQPEDNPALTPPVDQKPPLEPVDLDDGVALSGLAALRARDPGFDAGRFLDGSRQAYELVVKAFSEGDRETLKNLLSPIVLADFEKVIDQREAEGRSEKTEFMHPPRADLEKVVMEGDLAHVIVRFLAEFRTRSKGPEGEAVDDRRTAELWTFERNVNNRDPNWTLVHVGAAEA